jgi:hypothetical protein
MGKIIFWLVVVFIILLVLRLVNAAKARRRSDTAPKPADDMVRCVSCGTYVPRAEAKPGPAGLTCGERKCLSR